MDTRSERQGQGQSKDEIEVWFQDPSQGWGTHRAVGSLRLMETLSVKQGQGLGQSKGDLEG